MLSNIVFPLLECLSVWIGKGNIRIKAFKEA